MRVADAERQRVVDLLKGHLADGRLSVEEFSDRAGEAYASKTVGDLERCLRELPREPREVASDKRERREWIRSRVAHLAVPNLTCIGVWAITTGGHGYFWPIWVLFASGISLTRKLLRGPRSTMSDQLSPPATDRSLTSSSKTAAASTPADGDDHDGRVLATCLFVDVVGSTELAARLGDARWSDLLHEQHERARERVTKWGGQEIFTRGDELVAGFDSASRAVCCAREIRDVAESLGLEVRAGLHAGELQRRSADVSGIALHIGQRVSALAREGEILVSSTVKDMATGSGIVFEPRGASELRGVPGNWELFVVGD